ncbi:hypothetical protein P154DRAFT_573516 [Amniculicola lignicola CBS 123094]|uniref:Uncharacterized protein n=1 Tax=Amniculicola lignicola CBS 123094 TaxID=1392246 RepID=A0A6A5WSF4_9PLEO|nr:hypothetical protein P154DRAFT_573516 [Amniculicola lignicola CBS 123094]
MKSNYKIATILGVIVVFCILFGYILHKVVMRSVRGHAYRLRVRALDDEEACNGYDLSTTRTSGGSRGGKGGSGSGKSGSGSGKSGSGSGKSGSGSGKSGSGNGGKRSAGAKGKRAKPGPKGWMGKHREVFGGGMSEFTVTDSQKGRVARWTRDIERR